MMGEVNVPEGCQRTRSVLGDVTNVLGKRGLSSVSGSFDKNSCEGNCENVKKERTKQGTKCIVVNDKDNTKRSRPCIEINSLNGNVISGISKINWENKDPNSVDSGVGDTVIGRTLQAVDAPTYETNVARSASATLSDVQISCDSDETRISSGGFLADDAHAPQNEENDHGAENLIMSQTGSIDGAKLPDSQESICTGLGVEECCNLSAADMMKSCSCSFCKKAAYVWLDLHYQDMKGRITTIRKSQKDASILVEKSCRGKGTEKHVLGSSSTESKLEYELRSQWRSLFQHMEEKFDREANQLESSLLPLRDLRDKCKTELEVTNCSSAEDR